MLRLSTVLLATSAWLITTVGWSQEADAPARDDASVTDEVVINGAVAGGAVEGGAVEGGAVADETSASQDAPSPRAITIGVVPAGVQRHVSGRWATLGVNGSNRTSQDTEETSVVMIGDDNRVQYARRIWIPAGARRIAWMPIRIPDDLFPDQLQIPMTSIHLKETDEGESFQSNTVGMPLSNRSLLLSWDNSQTALIADNPGTDSDAQRRAREISDTIYAGLDIAVPKDQDLGVVQLGNMFLPPTAKPLDSLDQIVIVSDHLLGDTVGVNRLRAWLQSGGRIWVMADQVSTESVRALLGDSVCYGVVDTVQLNEFELEQMTDPLRRANPTETWSSETPVELLRVMVDTDDVQCRVDGWPAAFWMPVGQGEVLFTTLQAPGWLQDEAPTQALQAIARRFFVKRLDPPEHTEELATYLSKEIGYEIPTRGLIAALLGSNLLAIVAVGLWLARRRELQYMGFVVPAAAVLTTIVLLMVANKKTTAVPSTVARGQIVQAASGSSEASVESVAAIYSQEARPLPIKSASQAITRLAQDESLAETRRIRWNDSGKSEWLFVEQPPSKVTHATTDAVVTLPSAWSVRGRFTPTGLQGRITGLEPGKCTDPVVIAAAAPNLAVTIDTESGSFESGVNETLLPNQFFDTGLMSDSQQDRQALLRRLHDADPSFFPKRPSLFFWTEPVDAGTSFGDGFVQRGWALAKIPIELERLESGSPFLVPASFVRLEAHIGERGPSTVFNPETGRWLESMNRPNESELRCVVPRVLLPCELQRCRVAMRITAPGRTVEIKGSRDGQFETLHRVESPNGRLEFDIEDRDALSLDADGGFLIAIAVSETEQERQLKSQPDPSNDSPRVAEVSRSTWAIEYVHVHVEGTTL